MVPESRNRDLAVPRPKPSVHLPGCLPAACGPAHFGAAQPPLPAYPQLPTAYVRGPFTIGRRPPREGGRPGCRQHQQRRGNGNGPPGPLITGLALIQYYATKERLSTSYL